MNQLLDELQIDSQPDLEELGFLLFHDGSIDKLEQLKKLKALTLNIIIDQ